MARLRVLLALALAIAAAGCQDPYQQQREPRPRAVPAVGDALPPPARARDNAPTVTPEARTTPRAAIDTFCGQWANWSWRTIARQQRRLAALAAGALARQLASEARLRAADLTLRRDRIGSHGRVVAIDVKPGERTRRAVCVSFEEPYADGRRDPENARHRVYLATLRPAERGGWAITRWEPQP